jgi:O-antigen/teichoic acid export membrane protein
MLNRLIFEGLRIINDKLIVNATYIFSNAVATTIAGFLFWAIASRVLSSSQVGIATSIISIAQLLQFVGLLGLGVGIIRFLPEDEAPAELFTSVVLLSFLAVILLGSGYLLLVPVISPSLAPVFNGFIPCLIFILLLLLMTLFALLGCLYVAVREAKYSLYQIMIMNFFRLAVIYFVSSFKVWGIIGSLVLGYFIAILISGGKYLPRVLPGFVFRLRIYWQKIGQIISFSFGNYIGDIFRQMPRSLAAPIALEVLGKTYSAQVYIVWLVAAFVSGPGLALGNSALVEGVHSPRNYQRNLLKAGYLSIGITVPIGTLMYILTPFILGLFGEGYVEHAGDLFRMMLIASPFVTGNMVLLNYLRIKKFIKELVISSLLMSIIALSIIFHFMDTMGLISIGYGWFIAQIVVTFYLAIIYWAREKNE